MPGFLRLARARDQQEVADMQGKLLSLQIERDARAAAVEMENSRVRQLEAEVVQREQEVCLLAFTFFRDDDDLEGYCVAGCVIV